MELNELRAVPGVVSRSINAENPTGRKGAAASAASPLGPGRKGRPAVPIQPGETLTLADIDGPGVIRHLWMTVPDRTEGGPFVLRDLVLRMYWDGEDGPSVEVPLGDFFLNGFGERALVTSEPIVVAPTAGMNCYLPMPFRSHACITVTSEHPMEVGAVFFQVDYTLGDDIAEGTPTLHAQWRRSDATTRPGEDHVILDGVRGSGRYLGTYIGVAALSRFWWGEGEVKFYLDGDEDLPTLTSTGLEDYAGGAWAFQDHLGADPEPRPLPFSAPYCGYPLFLTRDTTGMGDFQQTVAPMHAMYRWHIPDPVWFDADLRVTVQQIGVSRFGLFERVDDVFSVAYWYQTEPHRAFPALPSAVARTPR